MQDKLFNSAETKSVKPLNGYGASGFMHLDLHEMLEDDLADQHRQQEDSLRPDPHAEDMHSDSREGNESSPDQTIFDDLEEIEESWGYSSETVIGELDRRHNSINGLSVIDINRSESFKRDYRSDVEHKIGGTPMTFDGGGTIPCPEPRGEMLDDPRFPLSGPNDTLNRVSTLIDEVMLDI